ncbi:TIGR04211 family SH3 domain-containing protein [Thiomicrorhabdus sp. 6S3-12]|uniref:TIGR04211 family SH3 domain-containing protein n=1 Tax=Thiomicrorhabdus sp. 6S3-12 TaxID=2819681 RepID=UPI001AADC7B7|nr:TIGR04211 family SH3 domain-containing protein [Thiomicrorhabdus sp. 6S3-12]MBO1922931.1 TIGR04211 family SH3 domain-containing protein [Thiomicrorhabdus sp. 6S3-12]
MKKSLNSNSVFSHAKPLALATLLGASFLLSTHSTPVQAAVSGYTNYVTDSIDVPVRRGAGYKYKISQMLKSGTPVKILEVNNDGWANVQYSKGSKTHTGWMPSSMLQNQPIAKIRLQEQIEKTNKVEEKFNTLTLELNTLKERFEAASNELSTIKQEKFEQSQELEHLKSISSNAVAMDEENKAMKVRLNEVESQNAIMREQIDQSEDAIKRQWFLTGGGVLLLGLLLGRFFRMPTKRKRWGEI